MGKEGNYKEKIEMFLVSIVIGACFFMMGYSFVNSYEESEYIACHIE
jgi:hypothetical protein